MKNYDTNKQIVRIPNSVWEKWTELKKQYTTVMNGIEVSISDAKLMELVINGYKEKSDD